MYKANITSLFIGRDWGIHVMLEMADIVQF